MPLFYKGVGTGTHWQKHDPRQSGGIQPLQPGPHSINAFMNHIANATTNSPYVSLTRSYEVAAEYAVDSSRAQPTANDRPYVFEIELDDPLPPGILLYDPVEVVAASFGHLGPLAPISYHHNGSMKVIIGLAQPNTPVGQAYLNSRVKLPGGGLDVAGARITFQLNTLVRAIRDAEVLCLGTIAPRFIVDRYVL